MFLYDFLFILKRYLLRVQFLLKMKNSNNNISKISIIISENIFLDETFYLKYVIKFYGIHFFFFQIKSRWNFSIYLTEAIYGNHFLRIIQIYFYSKINFLSNNILILGLKRFFMNSNNYFFFFWFYLWGIKYPENIDIYNSKFKNNRKLNILVWKQNIFIFA